MEQTKTKNNPLLFLLKKLKWPIGLIIVAVSISSLGSISGLLVPLFTGRMVDKFTGSQFNMQFILIFVAVFALNAVLSGIGLYLLSKIGEKVIYAIRSVVWAHIIRLRMRFF